MSCFKCQLGKNRLAKSYLQTQGSFVWTNLCYSQLELTFAILILSQKDLTKLKASFGRYPQHFSPPSLPSLLSLPLPLVPLHAPFPKLGMDWALFPVREGESTAKEDTLQVSPVCTTYGDRAHAHGLVLLSHHTEHPEGAGVRAFLQALQMLIGSQARRLCITQAWELGGCQTSNL